MIASTGSTVTALILVVRVEVEIIPKNLKGLSENEGHGERGVGGEGGEG